MGRPDWSGLHSLNIDRPATAGFFGNVALNYSKSLIFMLETEYLKTSCLTAEDGENLRLQFVTYLKF
ncbi:hypothetical protein KKC74_05700 [bacterium]|nr:hypothetical protein [bacterium]MBU1873426.1 hypothetical protein [bacterium]